MPAQVETHSSGFLDTVSSYVRMGSKSAEQPKDPADELLDLLENGFAREEKRALVAALENDFRWTEIGTWVYAYSYPQADRGVEKLMI